MKIWCAGDASGRQRVKSATQQGTGSVGVGFGGCAPKTHGTCNIANSHLWRDGKMGDTVAVKREVHWRKLVTVP